MEVDIETLADFIADRREWIRRQGIFTLECYLPVLVQGHHDILAKIKMALEKRELTASPEAQEKIKGLIEIINSILGINKPGPELNAVC